MGQEVGVENPFVTYGGSYGRMVGGDLLYGEGGNPFDAGHGCSLDRIAVPCSFAMRAVNSGAAAVDTRRVDLFNLRVADAVFVPDYSDSSRDYYDPGYENPGGTRGAMVGVTVGRFVDLGASAMTDGLTPRQRGKATQTGVEQGGDGGAQATIADDIKAMFDNPGCATYVKNLIDAVAATKNPAVSNDGKILVEKIRGGKGGYVIEPLEGIGGTVRGSITTDNATVVIGTNSEPNRNRRIYYADVGLHETIHLAGSRKSYLDAELAQAAFGLMTGEQRAASPLPDRTNYQKELDYILAMSRYWNQELLNHCPPAKR